MPTTRSLRVSPVCAMQQRVILPRSKASHVLPVSRASSYPSMVICTRGSARSLKNSCAQAAASGTSALSMSAVFSTTPYTACAAVLL